ncbi:hypothetical protein [Shewanella mangrovi]
MTTQQALVKVPAVTLGFWLIKVLATTLGETGGDAVSMSMNLGYLVSSAIFLMVFVAAVYWQIRAAEFQATRYWIAIIASTTVGTTIADFCTRSLGIGYAGGSALLLTLLAVSILAWYFTLGRVDVGSVNTPSAETFYWVTIMMSQTLGTALGDWVADTEGLGYLAAAEIFGGLMLLLLALYKFTAVSRTLLFWAAFVLTRPLGAVVGDWLDKPIANGGLDLSRYGASITLISAIVVLLVLLPQRAAVRAH